GLERAEIAVRVDAEIVVALAVHRAGEALELLLLVRDPLRVGGGRVTAVEPDLGLPLLERLDEPRPQPLVLLGCAAVELVRVVGEQEERRRGTGTALVLEDPVEAPVRVGSANLVHGRSGQAAELAHARSDASVREVALRARGRSLDASARPLPGHVDVVGQRDDEAGAAPARRLETEARAQPLERRVERVEARRSGPEAIVLVTRPVSLLDAGE